MQRILCLSVLVLLPGLDRTAAAQQKNELAPSSGKGAAEAITVVIGGKIGGKKIQGTGGGSCSHAADASNGGVSASLWTVRFGAEGAGLKQLNLTLWRPKDGGPDQLSLSVETNSGAHRIETGTPEGSKGEAAVTILPSGPGGRLEISGKEAGGKPVQITIECSAFAGVEAKED